MEPKCSLPLSQRPHKWTLSRARRIQSMPSHPLSLQRTAQGQISHFKLVSITVREDNRLHHFPGYLCLWTRCQHACTLCVPDTVGQPGKRDAAEQVVWLAVLNSNWYRGLPSTGFWNRLHYCGLDSSNTRTRSFFLLQPQASGFFLTRWLDSHKRIQVIKRKDRQALLLFLHHLLSSHPFHASLHITHFVFFLFYTSLSVSFLNSLP
jgi:hypothetical protein